MANFYIQSNIQVIPIEEIAFTDTNQKAKGIHSSIDRIFSNSTTDSCGSVTAGVQGGTTNCAGEASTPLSTFVTTGSHVYYLYIKNMDTAKSLQFQFSNNGSDWYTINTLNPGDSMLITPETTVASFVISNANSSAVSIEYLAYSVNEA